MKRNQLIKSSIYTSSFTMFLGCFIYIFLRPTESYVIKFIVSNSKLLEAIRYYTTQCTFPDWFLYSLPNGLWIFSYSLIILSIWLGVKNKEAIIWISSIPVVGFSYESLQFAKLLKGTFCLVDIIFIFLGIILGFIIIKIKLERER